jgi:hypothetical protein
MTLSRMAAAWLLLLTLATSAQACDSYADDMALASVLARAVAEARAQGSLPRLATAPPERAVPDSGERRSGSSEPERMGVAAGRASLAELSSSP